MENEKMTVRPPLAPIADNAKCKSQYEKLLLEYEGLEKLRVKDVDSIINIRRDNPVVTLEDFNNRVAAYAQRRDSYNAEFSGLIETREHVRANIEELCRQDREVIVEEARLKKEFDEKWGDDIPRQTPINVDLMFDNPDEWGRQSKICKQKYAEWSVEEKRIRDLQAKGSALFCAVIAEQKKFEDIQKVANAAFEDAARRTLIGGTVLTDEQLAEREKVSNR